MRNIYKVILCTILIITMCIVKVSQSNSNREIEKVPLQVISTEYVQPQMRTVNQITYYRPAQFLVTFKNIRTKQYYLTNNELLYNYLTVQSNFVYNTQILKEDKDKTMMKIVLDNKSYFFEANLIDNV